jgi:dipeptidyl aminopeptidase/acylaminoacyl peptidase
MGDEVEFLVISRFESLEAVRRFAGDDYERAVVELGRRSCCCDSTNTAPTTRPPDGDAGMRPEDLTKSRIAGDPRFDASGARVAFIVSGIDAEQNRATHSIWLAELDRGNEPRPLTALDGFALAPRWSPDGSQLAFLAARDSAQQLHLLTLANGEVRALTNHEEKVDECAWSPDGRYLAYSARVPMQRRIPTAASRGESRRRRIASTARVTRAPRGM